MSDQPYYVEAEIVLYPSRNRFQVPTKIRLNTMRDPAQVGFKTGVEYAEMMKEMSAELNGALHDAVQSLQGFIEASKVGTEESNPPPSPTLPQNSGSFVHENPAPAPQGGERKEMSEKQWDYIMRLCGRDTKMMNYVMEEYARLGLNFAGKDKPTSFQASKIIEHLKEMKGEK